MVLGIIFLAAGFASMLGTLDLMARWAAEAKTKDALRKAKVHFISMLAASAIPFVIGGQQILSASRRMAERTSQDAASAIGTILLFLSVPMFAWSWMLMSRHTRTLAAGWSVRWQSRHRVRIGFVGLAVLILIVGLALGGAATFYRF